MINRMWLENQLHANNLDDWDEYLTFNDPGNVANRWSFM